MILVDDEAVQLWCENTTLFSGIPIVYGGITTIPSCNNSNSTGFLEHFNSEELLAFGMSIRSNPDEIVVLDDQSVLSTYLAQLIRTHLPADKRPKLQQWSSASYTLAEIQSKLASLSPNSLVFIAGFQTDSSGVHLPPNSTYRTLGQLSRAPVIALSYPAMPGILAGSPNAGHPYGRRLATIALRILSGESPQSIPILGSLDSGPQIEASELQRWHIDKSLVPGNATIINLDESFLTRYRNWIICAGAFTVLQSLLLIALGINILARRRAQQELRAQNQAYRQALDQAASAAESRNRFVANMSHELRTPLNGVVGMSELLLDTIPEGQDRQYIQTIRSSASHLLVILNDILDVTQLEAGRLKIVERPFSPRQLVEEATKLFAPPPNSVLNLCNDISPDLPPLLLGDSARIRQILFNLIGNALKFTPAGKITINARVFDQKLLLSVRDSGIGIPPEKLHSIFERFAQVDDSSTRLHGGLGLGLSIAKDLATAMGGSMHLESEVGHGSLFTLLLPLKLVDPTPTLDETTTSSVNLQNIRVLVAEDNLVNLTIAKKLLERHACLVTTAQDGQLAVELCQTQSFDIILMDLQMPRLDGLAATRQIRTLDNANALVPIIALTASAMEGERDRCLSSGMTDYLSKPIDRKALEATIHRWLTASAG
jgi:signal transduction histidine kinase/CheY-like chemotaxis protein